MSYMETDDEETIYKNLNVKLLPLNITLEEVKAVPFKYVVNDVRVCMAEKLQPPEGNDWKSLAELIGLPPDTIKAIEHTHVPRLRGLHALQVFEEFERLFDESDGSVGQMLVNLALIYRDDVIREVLESIPCILKYYKETHKPKKPPKEKRTRRRVRLYITYCKSFQREALNMHAWLEKLGKKHFAIALDDHESFDPKSVEERFNRVKYVLVCVTPEYHEEILKPSSSNALANPKTPTHLIYRLMLNSFQNANGCNLRFIPLCCQGATTSHIPPFLREKKPPSKIRTYNYPEEHNELFYFLKDPMTVVEQHIKEELEEEKET